MFNLHRNETRIDHKPFLLTFQNIIDRDSVRKKNVLKKIISINDIENTLKKNLLLILIINMSKSSSNLLIMNL